MWRYESLILLYLLAGLGVWTWVFRDDHRWTRQGARGDRSLRRRQRVVECLGVGTISGVAYLAVAAGFVTARGVALVLGVLVGSVQLAMVLALEPLVVDPLADKPPPSPPSGALRDVPNEAAVAGIGWSQPDADQDSAPVLVAEGPRDSRSQDGSSSRPHSHSGPVIDVESQVQPSTQELVGAAVKAARNAGLSWDEIGKILGMDPQTASDQNWSSTAADESLRHLVIKPGVSDAIRTCVRRA